MRFHYNKEKTRRQDIMTLEELIERIGYIRNRANLSARKLSLALGKNAGYIHMLETNRNFAPTFETLLEILDACNTDTEEFFYYSIPAYRHDKEIIEKLRGVPEDKKEALIRLLT